MNEDLINRVCRGVAEVLALDLKEVKATSRLVTDLGAESLDLVELMYVLESEFEIRLRRDDISISAQLGLADEELHHDEVLTPRALELLHRRFPEAGDLLQPGVTLNQLAALLTVEEIARSVETKLGS